MSHLFAIAPPSSTPEDQRATTFQPVTDGGPQQHSGTNLVIAAYAFLWVVLMAWLFAMWRKQAALHAKIDGLERAIDRAVAKSEAK